MLGSCQWDWQDLRGELPAPAAAWLPCDAGDLIGPRHRDRRGAAEDRGRDRVRRAPVCRLHRDGRGLRDQRVLRRRHASGQAWGSARSWPPPPDPRQAKGGHST